MGWTIKINEFAQKQIKKIDKNEAKKIISYLKKIVFAPNPKLYGKLLAYDKSGIWRYRVEDYRILCEIKDKALIVLVLRLGHRKEIY